MLKGIKANLVLRNSQRILTPPFLVIIRHPWGCHQSWAGWPASQPRPRDWSDFKGRLLGGHGYGWRGCRSLTDIVQITGEWQALDIWDVVWVCDMLVCIPRQSMPYTFCVFISTSGKWAGKNTLQEGTKMTFLNFFFLSFLIQRFTV